MDSHLCNGIESNQFVAVLDQFGDRHAASLVDEFGHWKLEFVIRKKTLVNNKVKLNKSFFKEDFFGMISDT